MIIKSTDKGVGIIHEDQDSKPEAEILIIFHDDVGAKERESEEEAG